MDAVTATASGTTEMTNKEFFKLLMMFFKAISGDFHSEEVSALGAQLSSAKLSTALTTIEMTDIQLISTKLEVLIIDIQITIQVIQYQLIVMTGSAPMIDVKDAIADAVEDSILMLKIVSKNTKACESVEKKLSEAIGGTATSGAETDSATFITIVETFIKLVSADLVDITIVTQSTSITTAKVTLTAAQITTITTFKTSLTELIVKLKALTLTSAAVTQVSKTITSVIAGSATTGTAITGANFIIIVKEFLSVTKISFISVKITSLALTIATSKVTLTPEEQTTIKAVQIEINSLSTKIEAQIAITQAAFKEITGKEASEDDIKNAGSEIAAPSPGVNTGRPEISATDTAIMKMKSLTENKGACEKVKTFLASAIT